LLRHLIRFALVFCAGQDREQQTGKNADDGDHHQKLNEREGPAAAANSGANKIPVVTIFHFY